MSEYRTLFKKLDVDTLCILFKDDITKLSQLNSLSSYVDWYTNSLFSEYLSKKKVAKVVMLSSHKAFKFKRIIFADVIDGDYTSIENIIRDIDAKQVAIACDFDELDILNNTLVKEKDYNTKHVDIIENISIVNIERI